MLSAQNSKFPIENILLNPYEGFGQDKNYHDFFSANRFIRLYSFQSASRQENISFTVSWSKGLSYSGSFVLPGTDDCSDTFLEDCIQEELESRLLYGLDFNLPLLHTFIESPLFQLDYFYSLPDRDAQMNRLLLLNAEGLKAERFLKHEQAFLDILRQVHIEHPLLNKINVMRNLRLSNHGLYSNRTRYYRQFIDKYIQAIFREAIAFALDDDEAGLGFMQQKLDDAYNRIAREQNLPDERFTVFGKTLYKLFKLDHIVFPAQPTQLTDEEASDIFERLDAVQGAGPISEDQDERNLFYSCYASSLRNIYRLPEEERTHFEISLQTSRKLRHHNLSAPAIAHAITLYDPMAVHYPNYSTLIFEAMNGSHRKSKRI